VTGLPRGPYSRVLGPRNSKTRVGVWVRLGWGPEINDIPVEPIVAAVRSIRG